MTALQTIEQACKALRDWLDGNEFSGAIRISVANETVLEAVAGLANRADRVPNQITTRFGTASLTKSFTAASICRLVDQGRTTFDASATDLLPLDKRPSALSGDVTLHHLLTHTSGIADYYDEETLGAAAFEQVWLERPSYLFRTPSDFLPLFVDLLPLRKPGGSEGHYCNAGYILLGLVIEELTDRPFVEFVEEEVFAVAGMQYSGFFAMDEVHECVAVGYVDDGLGGWKTNHYAIPVIGGPDGGAFSTVGDLELFLTALSTGRLVDEETWSIMRSPHVTIEGNAYGYGLWMKETRSGWTIGGAGADPGFSARAFIYPDLQLKVCMLGNTIYETDESMRIFRSEVE